MARVKKFFGSPGTGKTSALISELEEKRMEGVDLKDVTFITFSNSAIDEVCERLDIRRGSWKNPHFRTLHGLCLSQLLQEDEDLKELYRSMRAKRRSIEDFISEFCHENNIPFENSSEFFTGEAIGNRAFSLWNAVIGEFYPKTKSIEDCLEILRDLSHEFSWIIEEWTRWKSEKGIIDYTDMLTRAYDSGGLYTGSTHVFIDEFQDLNRLEFELSKDLMDPAETVIVAGDDDQSIYSFKMARPDFLLNLEGEEIVLGRSHRLPSRILEFSQDIIKRVSKRKRKKIEPSREGGKVVVSDEGMSLEEFTRFAGKMALKTDKTVFLLLRTNRMVLTAQKFLIEMGIPFRKLKGSSIWDRGLFECVNGIAKLRSGKVPNIRELSWLIDHISPEHLSEELKANLLTMLNTGNMPFQVLETLRKYDPFQLIEFPSKTFEEVARTVSSPIEGDINFYVDTIHASKGREADYVFLADAITHNIEESIENDDFLFDSEIRTFYVGVTRAREGLFISSLERYPSFLIQEVGVSA